jgi:hypothetical protein
MTQNIQQYHIFCTKPRSRITNKYFSFSSLVFHGLLYEFWMQYFLFIITFFIYNCIYYNRVISFITTTANTIITTVTKTFVWFLHNF